MQNSTCPRCRLPLTELTGPARSVHATLGGSLSYVHCACGAWLVVMDATVLAATETPVTASALGI